MMRKESKQRERRNNEGQEVLTNQDSFYFSFIFLSLSLHFSLFFRIFSHISLPCLSSLTFSVKERKEGKGIFLLLNYISPWYDHFRRTFQVFQVHNFSVMPGRKIFLFRISFSLSLFLFLTFLFISLTSALPASLYP